MSTPDEEEMKAYEKRLQRRLLLLRQEFKEGKISISNDSELFKSLTAMRYAPDGSVDLSTVDGTVRAMALASEAMHEREASKQAMPLSEIQSEYFEFLERNFGEYYKIMVDRGMSPHDAGMALSRKPSSIELLTKHLPDFLNAIEGFWKIAAGPALAHVQDMHHGLKGVFGGDLFPSADENIVSKCGIYTDTLCLPDPFLRSRIIFERFKPEQQAYYFIKHGLNLLQYKELACAELNPPIVVVLPDASASDPYELQFFADLGKRDAVVHAGKIFGREFTTFDEVIEFATRLDSIDSVLKAIANPKWVLFDAEWKGSLKEQLENAVKGQRPEMLETTNPGIIVAAEAVGRMGIANELLIKARRLRAVPIIDAPTSWQYFAWKLESDADSVERETKLTDLHVVRGLQSLAENEMEWLGRVPVSALIEIRKTGAIDEIRSILGSGIAELSLANPNNFFRTSDQVFDNIQNAFDRHRKSIAELTAKKWKFAGTDIGSMLVVGSLAVTAAATGSPSWALAALAANQFVDAPKLKDIPQSIRDLAAEAKKTKQSPVGLLFKYAKK